MEKNKMGASPREYKPGEYIRKEEEIDTLRGAIVRRGDTKPLSRRFSVYLNDHYVGDHLMKENQGTDLLNMEDYLKSQGLDSYKVTSAQDRITIETEDQDGEDELKSHINDFLNRF